MAKKADGGQLGFPERNHDRLLTGIGFQASVVGLWLLVLIWENILECAFEAPADIVNGTGQEFLFAFPEPRQGIGGNIRLPRDGP